MSPTTNTRCPASLATNAAHVIGNQAATSSPCARWRQHGPDEARQRQLAPPAPGLSHQPKEPLQVHALHPARRASLHADDVVERAAHAHHHRHAQAQLYVEQSTGPGPARRRPRRAHQARRLPRAERWRAPRLARRASIDARDAQPRVLLLQLAARSARPRPAPRPTDRAASRAAPPPAPPAAPGRSRSPAPAARAPSRRAAHSSPTPSATHRSALSRVWRNSLSDWAAMTNSGLAVAI